MTHRQSILMSLFQQSLSVLHGSPSRLSSLGEVSWYPTYSSPWFQHILDSSNYFFTQLHAIQVQGYQIHKAQDKRMNYLLISFTP